MQKFLPKQNVMVYTVVVRKELVNMLISKIPKTANDVSPISTPDNWTSFFQAIHMFSDDFMESGRNDDSEQEHKKSLSCD